MRKQSGPWRSVAMLSVLLFAISLCPLMVLGQSTFTAQLTGVVTDASGAVIPMPEVTLTDVATNIAHNSVSDQGGHIPSGRYGPRPTDSCRSKRVRQAPEQDNISLAVSQQATLNVTLRPAVVAYKYHRERSPGASRSE